MLELNKIYNMDCLDGMKLIENKSIDMILCDLPYGTTACKWDTIIPFEPLWEQYERIIKDKGAIVLFGIEPFTSSLIQSNLKLFKYNWYWNKNSTSGFINAKNKPMNTMEVISIFSKGKTANKNLNNMIYNPQGLLPYNKITRNGNKKDKDNTFYRPSTSENKWFQEFTNYPKNYLEFSYVRGKQAVHPTQKPIELCEYLIKTYTNEGETVLDNCIGSGTTAIACINTNRNYIGFELDKQYFDVANERIKNL